MKLFYYWVVAFVVGLLPEGWRWVRRLQCRADTDLLLERLERLRRSIHVPRR
jgi:hypothetical protein